jgi:hypothetical protein
MDVVPYEPEWLPQLAALARVHARLVPTGAMPSDAEVADGLAEHRFWPFYTPGLSGGQTLLAVDGDELLAATQTGFVGHGWGYGAADDDGPDWLRDVHVSLFWLLAWPARRDALDAAGALAARVVGWARSEGLEGLEAFRGGPGFLPFGTQLSSRWPHLHAPLRSAGFRQPRDLLVFAGTTDPAALPEPGPSNDAVSLRERRGRIEAWAGGEPIGVCAGYVLGDGAPLWEDGADPDLYGNPDPSPEAPPETFSPDAPTGTPDATGRPIAIDTPDTPDTPVPSAARRDRIRPATWAVIRRLFVDADARGEGTGSALFAAQLRRLHRAGATRYLLHIPDSAEDQPAVALYAKFGRLVDRQQVLRLSF